MSVRTVQQRISAGNNFDGTAPSGAVANENNIENFPEEAAGGLFDFGKVSPFVVRQIAIKFGGQSTWSLSIVDVDAVEIIVASGTTEVDLLNFDQVILLKGQKLKLVTAGASTAMRARITVDSQIIG